MDYVNKKITVEYYKSEITKENKLSNISLNDLLNRVKQKELRERIYQVDDHKVRIEKMQQEGDYWLLNILRFREGDISKTAKLDEEAVDIDLDEDEYLSEDMTVIYNPKVDVFQIQRNRYCFTPSQISRLISEMIMCELKWDDISCKLIPILKNNLDEELKRKNRCKKLVFKISDWKTPEQQFCNDSMYHIASIGNEFEAVEVEVSISVGRSRKKVLNFTTVNNFINMFRSNNQDDVSVMKAVASLGNEDTKFEQFDLLSDKLNNIIEMQIEKRHSISFEKLSKEMLICFKNNIREKQFE